jgi:hypothetical protein
VVLAIDLNNDTSRVKPGSAEGDLARVMSRQLVIGSPHRFETRLSPKDCALRLSRRFRPMLRSGRADASGFWTSTGLRTVIRIRGVFTPAENGLTVVDYWIELKPYVVLAWLVSTLAGAGIITLGLVLAHIPLTNLWVFVAAAALVIAPNIYVSTRQAQWLVAFVRRELEASDSAAEAARLGRT